MPEMVPSQRPSPQANQDEGLYQQQQEHHQSSQREKKNAENAEHPVDLQKPKDIKEEINVKVLN